MTPLSTASVDSHIRPSRQVAIEAGLESIIGEKAQATVSGMVAAGEEREPVAVMKWWKFPTTDVVAQLSFGESCQQIESSKPNAPKDVLHDLFSGGLLGSELQLAGKIGTWLPFGPSKEILIATR